MKSPSAEGYKERVLQSLQIITIGLQQDQISVKLDCFFIAFVDVVKGRVRLNFCINTFTISRILIKHFILLSRLIKYFLKYPYWHSSEDTTGIHGNDLYTYFCLNWFFISFDIFNIVSNKAFSIHHKTTRDYKCISYFVYIWSLEVDIKSQWTMHEHKTVQYLGAPHFLKLCILTDV